MPASGIQSKFFAKTETTFNTWIAPAATDAIDLISLSVEPEWAHEKLQSHVGTASLQGEIQGKKSGKWTAVGYVKATTATGTAPDLGELYRAAFSTETIVGGTSVTYQFSDSQAPRSLELIEHCGDDLMKVINGCYVEQAIIEVTGGSAPKVTFSGSFASYHYMFGTATVSGAHSASDPTIQLTDASGDEFKLSPGVLIKFGSNDNAGAGYLVTAIDSASLCTISPSLVGSLTGGELVAPVTPSQTFAAGSILGGVECSLSIDSTSIGFISGKVTVNTGIKGLDKEATAASATSVALTGPRSVEGEYDVYFLDENSRFLGSAWAATTATHNVVMRLGANTAGARCKVNTPKCRFDVMDVPSVDGEVSMAKIKTVVYQNTTAADECTVVFD